jgi:hypothetical protein
MLVLALQFSKGIAGVGIIAVELRQDAHRARRGSGAGARAMREGADVGPAPSKRKRRQSVSMRVHEEDGSYDL